jgi:hypothetical protein
MIRRRRPPGVTFLAVFFIFGALMSFLAAVMLLFPHSILEPIWRLNPNAREGLVMLGPWAVLLMSLVCGVCTIAAAGLWRVTRWGYWTVLSMLTTNIIGDTIKASFCRDFPTILGLPIGGAMIAYLILRRRMFTP